MSDSSYQLLSWLQSHYFERCDGDWEHSFGFCIDNVDNPGWQLKFDLADTKLLSIPFDEINQQRSELDWIICKKEGECFVGYGGPFNLIELLKIYRDWVEGSTLKGESVWAEG